MPAATMRRRAGAAARAKYASDAAAQMEVARVRDPMGLRMRLAGSSFIVIRNTSAAPARRARQHERQRDAPQHLPAGLAEAAGRLLDARADLQHGGTQAANGGGQEQHGVGEYEERRRLVQRLRNVDAEEDERKGYDDARQAESDVGRSLQEPAVVVAIPARRAGPPARRRRRWRPRRAVRSRGSCAAAPTGARTPRRSTAPSRATTQEWPPGRRARR